MNWLHNSSGRTWRFSATALSRSWMPVGTTRGTLRSGRMARGGNNPVRMNRQPRRAESTFAARRVSFRNLLLRRPLPAARRRSAALHHAGRNIPVRVLAFGAAYRPALNAFDPGVPATQAIANHFWIYRHTSGNDTIISLDVMVRQ